MATAILDSNGDTTFEFNSYQKYALVNARSRSDDSEV
jgi:hypothetical protein